MMRCTWSSVLFVFLSFFAGPLFAQKSDRARDFKRLAEVGKEINELEARLESLKIEQYKLRMAVRPTFKAEYMESAEAKALRGKWQAVRITWGGDFVTEESLAKIHLEISEHVYTVKAIPIQMLGRDKKVYDAMSYEMNGIWAIDPTTEPKSIHYSQEVQSLLRVRPIQGLYKLEGDMLTIGWLGVGSDGPLRFDEKNIEIYKRLKDEPKKQAK